MWCVAMLILFVSKGIFSQECSQLPLEQYHMTMKEYIAQLNVSDALSFYDSISTKITDNNYISCEKAYWIRFERNEGLELNKNYEEALKSYYGIARHAEENKWWTLLAHTHISIARSYESTGRPKEGFKHLATARDIIQENKLDTVYARFCLRYASFHRVYDNRDSAKVYAMKSIEYGKKFNVKRSVFDGYLLMGILSEQIDTSVYYFNQAIDVFIENGDLQGAASQALNIAATRLKNEQFSQAFVELDRAQSLLDKVTDKSHSYYNLLSRIHDYKRVVFEIVNQLDSAYFHFKLFHEYDKNAQWWVNQQIITENAIDFAIEKEKEKNLYLLKESSILKWVMGVLTIFLLTFLVLLYLNRQKRKAITLRNRQIQFQNAQLEESMRQQSILLAEVHHRVKNNLQLIISLLTLQSYDTASSEISNFLTDISSKVRGIALIHEQLYSTGEFENINVRIYVENLLQHFNDFQSLSLQFETRIEIDEILLNLDTVMPLGIICSELISNSLKYAVQDDKKLVMSISLHKYDDKYKFQYADNGPGIDTKEDMKSTSRMGLNLVKNLVRQLQGESRSYNDNGACFNMVFKEKKVSQI